MKKNTHGKCPINGCFERKIKKIHKNSKNSSIFIKNHKIHQKNWKNSSKISFFFKKKVKKIHQKIIKNWSKIDRFWRVKICRKCKNGQMYGFSRFRGGSTPMMTAPFGGHFFIANFWKLCFWGGVMFWGQFFTNFSSILYR